MQPPLDLLALRSLAAERSGPEDLPDHGGVLQQVLLGRGQPVEARGDDPLQRLGHRKLGGPREHPAAGAANDEAAIGEHVHVLLRIERVPLGAVEQRMLELRREQRLLEQRGDQLRRVLQGKRRERERRRIQLAAAPRRPPLEQFGPRRAEHEQRHAAGPIDEMVDEVEQALVGPVDVLEHQDERTLLRQ